MTEPTAEERAGGVVEEVKAVLERWAASASGSADYAYYDRLIRIAVASALHAHAAAAERSDIVDPALPPLRPDHDRVSRLRHDGSCEAGRDDGDTYIVNGCDCAIRELDSVMAQRDEALLQRDETRADWVRLVDEHATLEALARRLVEALRMVKPINALLASPEVAALGKLR